MGAATNTVTNKTYTLRDVTAELTNGSTLDVIELQFEHSITFEKRKPGGSPVERQVITDQSLKVTAKGFNSNELSSADLVPGTGIEALSVTDKTDGKSLLPANLFDLFPVANMCLGTTKYGFSEKPSEWDTEIMTNVDNIDQYAASVAAFIA